MVRRLSRLNWPKSLIVRLALAIIGVFISYSFVSRAIDTGSLWQYLLALVIFVYSVKLVVSNPKK